MIPFLGDIAGMLEIFAIALGFVLLHRAKSESEPALLKTGAWVLIVGGVIVGLCTLYYWFVFRSQGATDVAVPMMNEGQMMGTDSD